MKFFQTTEKWRDFWKNRQINWQESYGNWQHPHRYAISAMLASFPWTSLFEVGCGGGANLVNIVTHFKDKQLGGIDVNEDAVKLCQKTFVHGVFKQGSVEDMMMSDDSVDVVLSDMCLIYIEPKKIRKTIKEIRRIARQYVVFCEFHSPSLLQRLKLRYTSGYFAYDYKKLLEEQGFYDIQLLKLPVDLWPGGEPQKTYCYLIKARVPRRK